MATIHRLSSLAEERVHRADSLARLMSAHRSSERALAIRSGRRLRQTRDAAAATVRVDDGGTAPVRVIVIPAYNEDSCIAEVVRAATDVATHVVVVDDGSTDRTAEVARAAGALVVRHQINRGLGGALGTGIAAALSLGADQVVTMDADGQHRAADARRVFERLDQGDVDFVVGSRLKRSEESGRMPTHRVLFNAIGNVLTYVLFGLWVSDSQSGLRGLSRAAAAAIDIRTNGMEVSSEFINESRKHRWRLAEIAIPAIYTDYSLSKGQSLGVGIRTAAKLILRRLIG